VADEGVAIEMRLGIDHALRRCEDSLARSNGPISKVKIGRNVNSALLAQPGLMAAGQADGPSFGMK